MAFIAPPQFAPTQFAPAPVDPVNPFPWPFPGTVPQSFASDANFLAPIPQSVPSAFAQSLTSTFVGNPPSLDPSFPDTIQSLQRKYASPEFASVPDELKRALVDADMARLRRGSSPIPKSALNTLVPSLASISTKSYGPFSQVSSDAIIDPPERSASPFDVLNNVKNDLETIVTSIPRIPFALAKEVTELPNIATRIQESQDAGNNIVTALAEAPGIRLLPGAFTVGNLSRGGEGITDLARHPLMTFLDLLPAAKQLELGARFGKLTVPIPGSTSTFAEVASRAKSTARATRLGQFADAMWGQQSRDLSGLFIRIRDRVQHAMDPNVSAQLGIDIDPFLRDVARESVEFSRTWQERLPEARRVELTEASVRAANDLAVTSDPTELAFLEQARALNEKFAQRGVDAGYFERLYLDGSWEIVESSDRYVKSLKRNRLRVDQARGITPIARAVRDHTPVQLPGIEGVVANIDPATIKSLIESSREFILNDSIPVATRREALRGLVILHEQNGFSRPARIHNTITTDIPTALKELADHEIVTTGGPIRVTPSAIERRNKFIARNSNYTDRRLAKLESNLPKLEQRVIPARWHELIHDRLRDSIQSRLELVTDNPNFDLMEQWLADGQYSMLINEGLFTRAELNRMLGEAKTSIASLRSQGWDPQFLHRVLPSSVQSINYPNPLRPIGELDRPRAPGAVRVSRPTQVKGRTLNYSPHVRDFTIALPQQALEWVNLQGAHSFLQEFLRTVPAAGETVAPFARTYADLVRRYQGVGRARAAFNPALDTATLVERAIQREWVRFPIDQLPKELRASLGIADDLGASHPYIPRAVYKNIRMLISPPEVNALLDVPLSIFRTSLLPLSPRWHIYNLIGGAIMLGSTTNPITVWKNLSRARDLGRAVRAGEDVSHLIPESMRATFGSSVDPFIEFNIRSGSTLGHIFNTARDSSPAAASTIAGAKKVSNFLSSFVEKSFRANGIVDDMYRSLAYLYGYDKAITKSLSKAEAMAAGERLARRTLQTLDTLTPMERSTLRYLIPFYGWTQHVIRYAYQYPADHPFRVAVTASIARNELADLGSGLPETLMNALFLGHPDKDGHVGAINLSGMNPFRDVANYMTLAGFLSASNPVISTALQQLGITQFGEQNLYPNLAYDAQTGRLKATHPNPLTNFIYNTIPITRLFSGIMDRSSEVSELMRINPAAAQRLMLSQAGFPILFRDYDIQEEQMKAEMTRYDVARDVLSQALKSGDDTYALQFPQLRPLIKQIRGLQSQGNLSAYTPSTQLQALQDQLANSLN